MMLSENIGNPRHVGLLVEPHCPELRIKTIVMAPIRARTSSANGAVNVWRRVLVTGVILVGGYTGFMLGGDPHAISHESQKLRSFLHPKSGASTQLDAQEPIHPGFVRGGVVHPDLNKAVWGDEAAAQLATRSGGVLAAGKLVASYGSASYSSASANEGKGKVGPRSDASHASASVAEGKGKRPQGQAKQEVAAGKELSVTGIDAIKSAAPPAAKHKGSGDRRGATAGVKGLLDGILHCKQGGPYRKGGDGVVYWKDWTAEAPEWEPLYPERPGEGPKYLTFEPDEGGFNNVRMSMEVLIVFAFISGRTLVMPDEYPMYLLGEKGLLHDFADFFDFPKISRHVKMMQMHEFLAKEALTGQLRNGLLPPNNQTTFDRKRPLWTYIRSVSTTFPFPADEYVLAFDGDLDPARLAEFRGDRKVATYTPELQAEKVLHFTSQMDGGIRWLTHFYAVFFFGDRARDNLVKRFVRDHLHYRDEVFCAAARIVELIRREANGSYHAIHIRRGDFQFKATRLPVEEIFDNVKDVLPAHSLLYVLTDEKDASYFDPVRGRYNLRFLSDYWDKAATKDANPNHAGMIEQVVASGAETFVGTYFSTFTSYITRLRGYQGKVPGYYFMPKKKYILVDGEEKYGRSPFFHREWEAAYAGIDEI